MTRPRDYPDIAVRALGRLRETAAFRTLPPDVREHLAHDTVKVIRYLRKRRAPRRVSDSHESLVEDVDFPAFVEDLVKGTFNAVVDSSIQQMEAYAALLKDVASSVDAYATDDDPANRERHRQKVAVAVLMGVKRISRS